MPESFRPDVFDAERLALVGARCLDCGCLSFPVRDSCPKCGTDRTPTTISLSTSGEIYSYSIVRQAPAGLRTPYVLAYVDLPQDSVRVMSRVVDAHPDEVRVGMPVELTTLPLAETTDGTSESDDVVMFAFRPTQEVTS